MPPQKSTCTVRVRVRVSDRFYVVWCQNQGDPEMLDGKDGLPEYGRAAVIVTTGAQIVSICLSLPSF